MKKITILLIGGALATATFAHEGADGVILERMNAMSSLGAVMQTMVPAVKSGDDLDIKQMKGQAAIMNTAFTVLSKSFPEGSTSDASEASPKIWEDPEGFSQKLTDLETAIDDFTGGVELEDQDTMKMAFEKFSGTCKACHTNYRIENF